MALKYRGIAYQINTTTVDTPQTQMLAKYRGQTYKLRQSEIPIKSSHTSSMIYRGASFHKNTFISDQLIPQTSINCSLAS